MLYLKPANLEDAEKEWKFVAAVPEDENGFTNSNHNITFEDFQKRALPAMINFSKGIGLPQGFVPETFYFLWDDDIIVGEFRIRHHLTPALENLSGHIGQFISKEYRNRGYCTQGLKMLIEEARQIVPENDLYLHCNSNNSASLKVMLKNGGKIHHQNENGIFVRIKLR